MAYADGGSTHAVPTPFPTKKRKEYYSILCPGPERGGRKGGIAWFGCSVAAAEVVKWRRRRRRYFKYCGSDTTYMLGDREKERDIAQEYMGTDMGTTKGRDSKLF